MQMSINIYLKLKHRYPAILCTWNFQISPGMVVVPGALIEIVAKGHGGASGKNKVDFLSKTTTKNS